MHPSPSVRCRYVAAACHDERVCWLCCCVGVDGGNDGTVALAGITRSYLVCVHSYLSQVILKDLRPLEGTLKALSH